MSKLSMTGAAVCLAVAGVWDWWAVGIAFGLGVIADEVFGDDEDEVFE